MTRQIVRFFMLCSLLLIGLVSAVQSQGETINYGDVVEASLSGSPMEYTFDGTTGDILTIRLEASDFDPKIELLDASGDEIASDDDSGGSLNSLLTFTVPSDGSYTIRVTSINETASGSFVLRLTKIEVQSIAFDTPINIETDGTQSFYFQFEAQAGDVVDVAGVTDGSSDMKLAILSPASEEIVSDDDGGESFDPLIRRALLADAGLYTVVLSPAYSGTEAGSIELTLSATEQLVLSDAPQSIDLGNGTEYDNFVLNVEAGTRYRVRVAVVSSDPSIRVLVMQGEDRLAQITAESSPEFSVDIVASESGVAQVRVESYFSFSEDVQQVEIAVITVE